MTRSPGPEGRPPPRWKKRNKDKPSIYNQPGHTRDLREYVLRDKPRQYVLDLPGLSPPPDFFEERAESWYALVAANCLMLPEWQQKEATAGG